MKRYTLYILLLFLFSTFNLKAQNTGYLGKHIILSLEGTFSGTSNILKLHKKQFWLKYGGSAEFIVAKRLGLGFSILRSSPTHMKFNYEDYCYNYSGYDVASNTYSIDLYLYNNRITAPIGKFMRFQISYFDNRISNLYANGILKKGVDPYSCPEYNTNLYHNWNIGTNLFYGKRRILYDVLDISYGFQLGITLFNGILSSELNIFSSDVSTIDNINTQVRNGNFFSYVIALKVNIGFVL